MVPGPEISGEYLNPFSQPQHGQVLLTSTVSDEGEEDVPLGSGVTQMVTEIQLQVQNDYEFGLLGDGSAFDLCEFISDESTSNDVPLERLLQPAPCSQIHEDHCYSEPLSDSSVSKSNEADDENSDNSDVKTKDDTSSGSSDEEIDVEEIEETILIPLDADILNRPLRGYRRSRNYTKQTLKRENTENLRRGRKKIKLEKDEETRSRHNRMERERRNELKERFQSLARLLPSLPSNASKVSVLKKAVEKITEWESSFLVLSNQLKQEQRKNAKLQVRILDLEERLQEYSD